MTLRIAHAAIEADPDLFPGTRTTVERARALPAPEPEPAAASTNGAVVDVAFEPVTVSAPADGATLPAADAAATVIATLLSERRAAQGDYDHPHRAGDCPFCRRAVAAYR